MKKFAETVRQNLRLLSHSFTLDQVLCCYYRSDAIKVLKALKGRLTKFGLQLNDEKTKVVEFNKREFPRVKQGTFDYLGFTFYIRRSRIDHVHVVAKTSRKRHCSKLRNVKHWCKTNRCKHKLHPLWNTFNSKLRGHIQYYGISLNLDSVNRFVCQATHIFFKWMNRRSQKKSMNWEQFKLFLKAFPSPKVKVCHQLF